MAEVKVRGLKTLGEVLDRLSLERSPDFLQSILEAYALKTQGLIRSKTIRRSGGAPLKTKLTNRSFFLNRSIGVAYGKDFVDIGTNAPYGLTHEVGGVVNFSAHTRRAHTRKQGGKTVRVRSHTVGPRTVTYRKRPFIQPAHLEASKQIENVIAVQWERYVGRAT